MIYQDMIISHLVEIKKPVIVWANILIALRTQLRVALLVLIITIDHRLLPSNACWVKAFLPTNGPAFDPKTSDTKTRMRLDVRPDSLLPL